VITAGGVTLALAAAVGTAWGLHATGATPHKAALSPSAVAARADPGLADVVSTLGYQQAISAGTGLVLTSSGEVLTNNHVIEGATSIKVTDVGNGRTYPATVVGYDSSGDIAVLHLQGASGLRTVTLGNSSKVTVGEKVIALGNAGGKGGTPAVAAGKVTGLSESITATDEAASASEHLTGLIRTNAGLQAGDSGGPLVSTTGAGDRPRHRGLCYVPVPVPVRRNPGFRDPGQPGSLHRRPDRGGPLLSHGPRRRQRLPGGRTRAVQRPGQPIQHTSRSRWGHGGIARRPGGPGRRWRDRLVDGHPVSSPAQIQALLEACHPGDKVSIRWDDPAGMAHAATVVLTTGPAG
jgi:S1-C subfamily serine protease